MKTILITLISLLISTSCNNDSPDHYSYKVPDFINDGLQVTNLNDAGLDMQMIERASERIKDGKYGEIHSMLIYKDNRLVFEDYYQGYTYQWDAPGHKASYVSWNRDMQHCIHSDTKSITSLCIGIAIDKGFIKDIKQSIFDYLPDYQHLKTKQKEKITIENLLTMTSGLQWEEWKISLGSLENDQIAIWFYEEGPINYVLNKPVVAEPGKRFNYSGGDIQLLAEILKNSTGMALDEFSAKYLFEPMGIKAYDWWLIFPSGEIQAAGGLKLTPREMVKIGAMMLEKGVYDGTRIISEDWVGKCLSPYLQNKNIKVPGEDIGKVGYGYTWWTKKYRSGKKKMDLLFALGWGGQKILVMPDYDMVIVFTGANYTSKVHQFEILKRYILPPLN
jgi:CubicO group peptidase (beta-lactamase class C family)